MIPLSLHLHNPLSPSPQFLSFSHLYQAPQHLTIPVYTTHLPPSSCPPRTQQKTRVRRKTIQIMFLRDKTQAAYFRICEEMLSWGLNQREWRLEGVSVHARHRLRARRPSPSPLPGAPEPQASSATHFVFMAGPHTCSLSPHTNPRPFNISRPQTVDEKGARRPKRLRWAGPVGSVAFSGGLRMRSRCTEPAFTPPVLVRTSHCFYTINISESFMTLVFKFVYKYDTSVAYPTQITL